MQLHDLSRDVQSETDPAGVRAGAVERFEDLLALPTRLR
jgi:hypothetical protein